MTQSMKTIKPTQAIQENTVQENTMQGKKTNILFVYHRFDVIGGIETRWMDEFVYLKKQNFCVHFFTNENECNPKLIPILPSCHLVMYPFDDINNAAEFVRLVETMVSYMEANNIDIVSIHMQNLFSFAAVIAAQLCKVAAISTTHGILELYQKPIEKILFGHIARQSFSLNAYVNNLPYAVGLPMAENEKTIIPNLVNLDAYKVDNSNYSFNNNAHWLMVSRISKEKFPSIIKFIQTAYHCDVKTVHIAGGGDTQPLLEKLEDKYKEVEIVFLGERDDIPKILPNYSLLGGMGRVALEGMACQVAVCIITPDGKLKGLVTPYNFDRLKAYNFTGNTLKTIEPDEFNKQLSEQTEADISTVYQLLKQNLSTERWNDFIPLYKEARYINNQLLNRLFHKITYFANNFSTPFIEDELFLNLLYETLLQEEQEDILRLFEFYQNTQGLTTSYPNPYHMNKTKKKKWIF